MVVRRAGHSRQPDGSTITWTVADGRRGRRWRTVSRDATGCLVAVLLLELDPTGRLSKVELAGPAGLLTLHPAAGRLHGNVVGPGGVRHVNLAWSAEYVLLVDGSPVTDAAAGSAAPDGVGEQVVRPALIVGSDLEIRASDVIVSRGRERSVTVDAGSRQREIRLDGQGIPDVLRGGGDWPLELD